MKKILAFLVLTAMALFAPPAITEATAQEGSAYTFPVIAGDSLVTADTVFKKISITDSYSSLGVQVSIKKATGTLDGKLYLWTSVGGVNYVLTDSASITALPVAALISNGGYTHQATIQRSYPTGTKYIAFVTQSASLTASPTKFAYTTRK